MRVLDIFRPIVRKIDERKRVDLLEKIEDFDDLHWETKGGDVLDDDDLAEEFKPVFIILRLANYDNNSKKLYGITTEILDKIYKCLYGL